MNKPYYKIKEQLDGWYRIYYVDDQEAYIDSCLTRLGALWSIIRHKRRLKKKLRTYYVD